MIEKDNNKNLKKDEFFEKMAEFEEKWMKMLDIKDIQFQKQISDLKENSEDIVKKTKVIIDNYSNFRVNESKINDFISFQNKVNDMLITHEIRINNNIKDISNFSSKFDKIISENIYIPGFIGPSCQYKTLSEYINFNMDEINRIKLEKDTMKKEQKEYKAKIESFIKQMVLLNETSMIQNREYTNRKQKDYELFVDRKLQPLNDKIFRFYELSSQFQSGIEKDIKLFRKDFDKILEIKEELNKIIKEKEENIKNNLDDLYKKIVLNIQDIGINKNKIIEIKNQINEVSKSYNKLNSNINEINKEIKLLKNSNISRNMTNSSAFNNNLDLNHLSLRRPNKYKSNIYHKIENIDEKINNQLKKENKDNDLKDKFIDNDTEDNDEELKKEVNNIEKKDKSKLINKKKKENKNNQISKNEYKSIYNNMLKEKENNDILETFYQGKTKIPILTKPFFLDQRILSDEEMRSLYKERTQKKKEKEKIRNNVLNFEINSKNINDNINIINKRKNFNINSNKLSIPRMNYKQNSEDKMNNITHLNKNIIQTLNNNDKEINNKNAISMQRINNLISPKTTKNKMKHVNLINLKLDGSVAINPDTNNGAYILAKNQKEYYNKTRLNLTPTSCVHLFDNSKGVKTSKLVRMTFIKEEQKMTNSLNNSLENE